MRWPAVICLVAISSIAPASIPSGKRFGPWHVISLSSGSGTSGNDASVMLSQERGCSTEGYGCSSLEVRWDQGSDVKMTGRFEKCLRDDEAFESYLSISVGQWNANPSLMERRAAKTFKNWLAQANVKCRDRMRSFAFSTNKIDTAVREFSLRLNYWSK